MYMYPNDICVHWYVPFELILIALKETSSPIYLS